MNPHLQQRLVNRDGDHSDGGGGRGSDTPPFPLSTIRSLDGEETWGDFFSDFMRLSFADDADGAGEIKESSNARAVIAMPHSARFKPLPTAHITPLAGKPSSRPKPNTNSTKTLIFVLLTSFPAWPTDSGIP